MGNTKLIYPRIHRAIFHPFPSFASFIKFSQPQPYFVVQNNTKVKEPKGRIRLLTIKSSKSIMLLPIPIGCTDFHTLNPNTHGIEKQNRTIPLIRLAFLLPQPNNSTVQETRFSNTANTVDNAANDRNIKNKLPQTLPKGR